MNGHIVNEHHPGTFEREYFRFRGHTVTRLNVINFLMKSIITDTAVGAAVGTIMGSVYGVAGCSFYSRHLSQANPTPMTVQEVQSSTSMEPGQAEGLPEEDIPLQVQQPSRTANWSNKKTKEKQRNIHRNIHIDFMGVLFILLFILQLVVFLDGN